MISGIYNLIDASLTQQQRFETISNNLANSNTNAFKKDITSFEQALAMNHKSATDFSPGFVRFSGNELDVALETQGFFKIESSRGIRYTRDGAFTLNAEGILITRNGEAVLGQNGTITINGSKISIESDGQILVDYEPVDKLMVVNFDKPQLLKKEGGSYYQYKGEERDIFTAEDVNIKQSYIEGSNVSPTEEMIKMVETFRAFESVQRAIQSIDEITSKMVNDYGLVR